MNLRLHIFLFLILQVFLVVFSNSSVKNQTDHKSINQKNVEKTGIEKKHSGGISKPNNTPIKITSYAKTFSQPGRHVDPNPHLKHLKNKPRKQKRSNLNEAIGKSMLQLEASNGFQKAIETDITELDSPRDSEHTKRQARDEVVPLYLLNNISQPVREDLKKSFELVSKTAQFYTDYISSGIQISGEFSNNYSSSDDENNGTTHSQNDSVPLDNNRDHGTNFSSNDTGCQPWSDWSACTAVCGDGISTRYRDCYDANGTKVPQHQVQHCSDPNCKYCSEWSRWSNCTKTCGIGVRYKERICYFNDGSDKRNKKEEFCNTQSCETKCGNWSDWGNCSKPCDGGVSIRFHTCDLPDGTSKTFYDHRVCNTQPCVLSTLLPTKSSNNETLANHPLTNDSCLSTYLSFEKFHKVLQTVYDEGSEHNDVESTQVEMMNGNYSCGYSALFEKPYSYLKFYDDIYRRFTKKDISLAFWLNIDGNGITNKKQTIFYLSSQAFHLGKHSLEITEDLKLRYLLMDDQLMPIREGISELPLSPNTWNHIYIEYLSDQDKFNLVINGKPTESKFTSTKNLSTLEFIHETTNSLNLNFQGFGNSPTLDQPFKGILDEVYIFKCPLQLAEIRNIANICRFRNSFGCPSPLEGLCDDCPFCQPRYDQINVPSLDSRPTPQFQY